MNNKEFHTNLLVENLLENIWKKSSLAEGQGRGLASEGAGREESWEDLGSVQEKKENESQKGLQNVGSDPSINGDHDYDDDGDDGDGDVGCGGGDDDDGDVRCGGGDDGDVGCGDDDDSDVGCGYDYDDGYGCDDSHR